MSDKDNLLSQLKEEELNLELRIAALELVANNSPSDAIREFRRVRLAHLVDRREELACRARRIERQQDSKWAALAVEATALVEDMRGVAFQPWDVLSAVTVE